MPQSARADIPKLLCEERSKAGVGDSDDMETPYSSEGESVLHLPGHGLTLIHNY